MIYFKAIVMLAEIHQRQLPEPPGFDRQRYRADVVERLEERVEQSAPVRRTAPAVGDPA
jgi:hypothetical protein